MNNFGGILQAASPLLGLIPGAGMPLAAAGSAAGALISAQQESPSAYIPAMSNQTPFGRRFASGGDINVAPGVTQVKYPGNKTDAKKYTLGPNDAFYADKDEIID